MQVSLIIPAAGLGSRFRKSLGRVSGSVAASRSKLSYELNGEPVLLRTLRVFSGISQIRETILAITSEMRAEALAWARLVPKLKVRCVPGGKTRAESVWNALKKTSFRSDWIMVHDGARPLVTPEAIRKVLKAAQGWDGVILARKVVPTIKRVLTDDGHICETVDRGPLYEAETPQLVRRELLFQAYRQLPKAFDATDEASLLEAIGCRVRVAPHDGLNPKLTTVTDLALAEAVIHHHKPGLGTRDSFLEWVPRRKASGAPTSPEVRVPRNEVRFGIGFDTHRMVKGRKLWLGGVAVPSPKGSLGHSDGDALLHAVGDAMLGAIGAGDIGEWFSDKDRRWKDMKSSVIIRTVLAEARRQGWTPYHVDSNILLQAPRLGPHKRRIRKNVAKLVGIPEKDVSVKARTREGLGPEGEGLCVTCEAIVAMRKV